MTGWWFQPLWTICPSCGSASLYDGWTSKKTTKKHQSDHHRFYLLNIIRKNRFKLYIPITNGHFLSKPLWFTTNTPPIRPAALADSFSISSVPPQDGDQLPGCDDGERRWWRATICFFVQLSYIKRVAWCRSYYIMTHLWEDTWRYPTYEWLNDLHTEHWKQSTNVYHDYWRQSHETGVDTHKIGLTVCSLAEVALPKSSCGIIGCGISMNHESGLGVVQMDWTFLIFFGVPARTGLSENIMFTWSWSSFALMKLQFGGLYTISIRFQTLAWKQHSQDCAPTWGLAFPTDIELDKGQLVGKDGSCRHIKRTMLFV